MAEVDPLRARTQRRAIPPELVEIARVIYAGRRKRDAAFGPGRWIFGEPAWDILLDLFIAFAENRDVTVSSACLAAAATPPTTALRYVTWLEETGYLDTSPDATDRRKRFVVLSARAQDLVCRTLEHWREVSRMR